jgi:hypothetical protein
MPKKNPEDARKAARKAYLTRYRIVRINIPIADVPDVEAVVGSPLDGPRLTNWVLSKIKEINNHADRD